MAREQDIRLAAELGRQPPLIDVRYSDQRAGALLSSPGQTFPQPDGDETALALLHLRRLANRHGCHADHCKWPRQGCDGCAGLDESAHDADVRAYREVADALTRDMKASAVAAAGEGAATAGQARAHRGERTG